MNRTYAMTEPTLAGNARERDARVEYLTNAAGRCIGLLAIATSSTPREVTRTLGKLVHSDTAWKGGERDSFVDAFAELMSEEASS